MLMSAELEHKIHKWVCEEGKMTSYLLEILLDFKLWSCLKDCFFTPWKYTYAPYER